MKRPEALRLAGELDPMGGVESEAAAELRRLHEVNAELLEALTEMYAESEKAIRSLGILMLSANWHEKASAAIAKATGEQNAA